VYSCAQEKVVCDFRGVVFRAPSMLSRLLLVERSVLFSIPCFAKVVISLRDYCTNCAGDERVME
ncbi:hypothetical protein, partial [Mycobacterium tuberculosis]